MKCPRLLKVIERVAGAQRSTVGFEDVTSSTSAAVLVFFILSAGSGSTSSRPSSSNLP